MRQTPVLPSPPSTIRTTGRSQSIASSAQQRIWLDERIYFDRSTSSALYNILLPLIIKHGSMLIERIRLAITTILERHTILRTAVRFNEDSGQLEQIVQPVVDETSYSFQVTHSTQSSEQIDNLLTTEFVTHFANVERGVVVRCHLIKMSVDDGEHLLPGDIIVFVFHHIAFDLSSVRPFWDEFTQAYDLTEFRSPALQYIDFTLYEHE